MTLTYTDVLGDGLRHKIEAEITTEHSASSYGMPVVVLPDGHALDAQSWVLLGYQVERLTETEKPLMEKWLTNLYAMMGIKAATSKAGSAKSKNKSESSRKNGALGGRPRKIKKDD